MTNNIKKIIIILIIIIIGGAAVLVLNDKNKSRDFVVNISDTPTKYDLINLTTPEPNQEISSPLVIAGNARGNWSIIQACL